jgi:bifunctional DNase/RNase
MSGDIPMPEQPDQAADALADERDGSIPPAAEALAEPESEPEEVAFSPTPYVPMEYVDVVMALPAANPTLVLREIAGLHRELHIPIALADGVAIAYAAEQIETPRPLTHELITNVLDAFGLTLETVRITQVVGSSFSAELVLTGQAGMRVLECRVSDGVCLALRQRLPVPVTADSLVLFHAAAPTSPY